MSFYVTGKTHPIERRIVDDSLDRYPELRHELRLLQRLQQGVRQIGEHRDLNQCTANFMARYTKPEPSRWRAWLNNSRDHIVYWAGGLVVIPSLVLNTLEISLAEIGTAIIDFLRIPDAIQFLQNLLAPAIVESMNILMMLSIC